MQGSGGNRRQDFAQAVPIRLSFRVRRDRGPTVNLILDPNTGRKREFSPCGVQSRRRSKTRPRIWSSPRAPTQKLPRFESRWSACFGRSSENYHNKEISPPVNIQSSGNVPENDFDGFCFPRTRFPRHNDGLVGPRTPPRKPHLSV